MLFNVANKDWVPGFLFVVAALLRRTLVRKGSIQQVSKLRQPEILKQGTLAVMY